MSPLWMNIYYLDSNTKRPEISPSYFLKNWTLENQSLSFLQKLFFSKFHIRQLSYNRQQCFTKVIMLETTGIFIGYAFFKIYPSPRFFMLGYIIYKNVKSWKMTCNMKITTHDFFCRNCYLDLVTETHPGAFSQ